MRPGREIDTRIAQEVFGHKVWAQGKILFENAALGDRPLRKYSKEIEWALEVAKQMKIALLPIEGGGWFAFVGPAGKDGWESPTAMLEFLSSGQFDDCGASVSEELPLAICEAALKAAEKRRALAAERQAEVSEQAQPPQQGKAPQLSVVEPKEDKPDSLH